MTAPPPGWDGLLDPGEQILWQGQPDGRFRFGPAHAVLAAFGAVFAGFALVWMILAAQAGGLFWTFGLIHFSVGLAIMLGGPLAGPFIRRRTWYTLTDHRAFIATHLPLQGKRLKSYPITATTPITFAEGDVSTIHFATEQTRTKRGLRQVPVGFDQIPEGRKVLALIRQVQAQSAPTAPPKTIPEQDIR